MIKSQIWFLIFNFTLFGGVQSGKESIGLAMHNLWHNSSKFTTEKARLKLASHDLQVSDIADAIDGYGCWCYFDNSFSSGRGEVMNELDEICKILHDGYKCAIVDCKNENKGDCEPWNVDYISAGMASFNSLIKTCEYNNEGNMCAVRACIVEGWFANAILDVLMGKNYKHDAGLLHGNGFEKEEYCQGVQPRLLDPESRVQCCGEFPHRYPYQDFAGERQCCGQVVYSTTLYECCENNMVSVSC